jgi:YHS domain-containing protein
MKRRAILAIAAAALSGVALGQSPAVAIKGYDPVSYFVEGRPVKGMESISHDFDDSRYFFSSEKHRKMFAASPEKYVPQFAALCAAGLADGRRVPPDPTAFVVRDGKLYLFEAQRGVERVKKDPSLLTKAHENYPKK